jgi:hypothetical protein
VTISRFIYRQRNHVPGAGPRGSHHAISQRFRQSTPSSTHTHSHQPPQRSAAMLTSVARVSALRLVAVRTPSAAPLRVLRSSPPTGVTSHTFSTTARTLRLPAGTTATDTATRGRKAGSAGLKTAAAAAATKKKPKKKPAAKAKAKPKKRVRKELTPEEKAKEEIRTLKKRALLKRPDNLPETTWTVYMAQHLKGEKLPAGALADRSKSLASSYKSLLASEMAVSDFFFIIQLTPFRFPGSLARPWVA